MREIETGTSDLLARVGGGTTVPHEERLRCQRARRALFSGERIDAVTAGRWGLLDWVVDADELAGFALATAEELAAGAPESMAAMKQNLLDAERHGLGEAMDREVSRHLACGLTGNHEEAVRAFVEKRPPVFG